MVYAADRTRPPRSGIVHRLGGQGQRRRSARTRNAPRASCVIEQRQHLVAHARIVLRFARDPARALSRVAIERGLEQVADAHAVGCGVMPCRSARETARRAASAHRRFTCADDMPSASACLRCSTRRRSRSSTMRACSASICSSRVQRIVQRRAASSAGSTQTASDSCIDTRFIRPIVSARRVRAPARRVSAASIARRCPTKCRFVVPRCAGAGEAQVQPRARAAVAWSVCPGRSRRMYRSSSRRSFAVDDEREVAGGVIDRADQRFMS